MELPLFTSFRVIPKASFCPFSLKQICHGCSFRRHKLRLRWSHNSKPFLRITMSSEKDWSPNGYGGRGNGQMKSGLIDVIGIGSRKDAVLDFCLNSPFQLNSLRFWNILTKESEEVQLLLRSPEEEPYPRMVKPQLFMKSCSKAIILKEETFLHVDMSAGGLDFTRGFFLVQIRRPLEVASAGYGSDHDVAVDIFETVRSANGFTVAIVLKPFSFEGLRRQDEVKNLIGKLKDITNLLIEINIDALLKKDLVTLDEALKTANNAVLLAINAISILTSDMHRKLVDGLHDGMKEVSVSEMNKILESYKEARIGFGAAYNIKTSILQSIFDCPFLGVSLKDSNSAVICILASSVPVSDSDMVAFLHTFRQTTEYTGDIIISTVLEPNLEPNLIITTVLTLGLNKLEASQNGGILFRLAQYFPFVLNFWGRQDQQPFETLKGNAAGHLSPSELMDSPEFDEEPQRIAADVMDDNFNNNFETSEPVLASNNNKLYGSRGSEQNREEISDTSTEYSILYDAITEGGDSAFQREELVNWNLGPGYELAQEWAKQRAADASPMVDDSIFNLPVGVRPSEELKDSLKGSFMTKQKDPETENDLTVPKVNRSVSSWSAASDGGLELVREFASTLLKGKYADRPKKHGVLSVRAASMLEAERDSSKKWSPIVEMQYRGGTYKGRCQGGLPEGKGRLVLGDGSIYDGIWRYGKRSGPGTFYFRNGDVFQGSWRDDVMHGKGWFYFHTGDRWFVSFWKGKANGEGRFYTKSGDAFFGNFKDGWRHGQFLCVNANGTRYVEIWEQGVLVGSKSLDKDAGAG